MFRGCWPHHRSWRRRVSAWSDTPDGRLVLSRGNQAIYLCRRHRTPHSRGGLPSGYCARTYPRGRGCRGEKSARAGTRALCRGWQSPVHDLEPCQTGSHCRLPHRGGGRSEHGRQGWSNAAAPGGANAMRRSGADSSRPRRRPGAQEQERLDAHAAGRPNHGPRRNRFTGGESAAAGDCAYVGGERQSQPRFQISG